MRTTRPRHILTAIAAVGALAAGLLVSTPAIAEEPAANPSWNNVNTEFITRDGTQLKLGEETFRFNGANLYWLGLDENVGGVDYPTFFRIKNALDTAKELGLSVVRSHMMTSTGQDNQNPLALMPALGEYNDEAFATIDYAIAYAGSIGLRFILPLTDEWSYYHGGHRDFTTPLGLDSADFYTDPAARAAFNDYVDHILTRTNALTGVRYVDDPTVLAWELGNELEGMPPAWIADQASFIKERAPQQLVAAGRRFDIDPDTLSAPGIDIVDVHYYPPTAEKVAADAATITNAGKVYIAGEYGSNSASTELLGPLVSNVDVTGMMLWSLFGHNDRGGFVPHDDGFTLHYPGATEKMRAQNDAIKAYSEALGFATGTVEPSQPLITQVTTSNGINSIAWRGSAAATSYLIERSTDGTTWSTVAEAPAEASPVLDLKPAGDVEYRVTARKTGGASATSDVVAVPSGSAVLVDPLESLLLAAEHENVRINAVPAGSRAVADGGDASLTWKLAGAQTGSFLLAAGHGGDVRVSSSTDGTTWVDAATDVDTVSGLTRVRTDDFVGENIRVQFAAGSGVELARGTLTGQADRAALVDPLNDLSLTAAHSGALSFDSGNAAQFGGDSGRVKRDSADSASLTWQFDDISGADFTAWYWPDQPVIPLTVSGSANGSDWAALIPQISGGAGNWKRFDYSLRGLENTNFIKISWDGAQGEPWTPQIGQLTLFSPNAAQPGKPGDFTITSPSNGAEGITASPTLAWASAPEAAYYRVVLATDSALTNVVEEADTITTPNYTVEADLAAGTTYYWQVTAVNGYGETFGTPDVASFSTASLPTDVLMIDDFESYADDAALSTAYPRNTGGGPVTATRSENPDTGTVAGRFAYDLTGPGYAGVIRTLPTDQSWWGYRGLEFEAQATAGQTLTVQFVARGSYWETVIPVTNDGWQTYSVDFGDFAPPAWAGEGDLDLTAVTQYAFYRGGSGAGELLIDNVRTYLADAGAQAPVNIAPPTIAGTPEVGSTLTADSGEWDVEDATFSYQWQRDGIDIPTATADSYKLTTADQGKAVSVIVTAANPAGVTASASDAVTVLYASSLSLKLSTPLALSFLKVKATVQLTTSAPAEERSVTIKVAGKSLTAKLDATGKATVTLPKLPRGVYSVTAEYSGSSDVSASKSQARTLVILF